MMDSDSIFATLERVYFSEHPDEEDVLRRLPAMLAGVRHFVDIGASLGPYTLHASRILKGGHIDAFEADPVRAARLQENCAQWAAASGNVISAHHAAVAKTNGTLTFYSTQSNVSGGLFPNSLSHLDEKNRANVSWRKIEVPAVSLDEFYGATPPHNSLKWTSRVPKGKLCRELSGYCANARHGGSSNCMGLKVDGLQNRS